MVEEATGPGRRFHVAPLEHPFARGVNFQIETSDVDALYADVRRSDLTICRPLEAPDLLQRASPDSAGG